MAQAAAEVVAFVALIQRFCAQPIREGGPELAADMTELQRGADLIALKFSEMAATFAATNEFDAQGSVSPIHWIRSNCHMGAGAAADRVAVGEQLSSLPQSSEAMAEGEIGFPHLALIARTAAEVAESGPSKPFDEAPLLDKARYFTIRHFRDFCHHVRHAADPEGYAAEEAQGVEARSLTLSPGAGRNGLVAGCA